jgi:hypothetical protein
MAPAQGHRPASQQETTAAQLSSQPPQAAAGPIRPPQALDRQPTAGRCDAGSQATRPPVPCRSPTKLTVERRRPSPDPLGAALQKQQHPASTALAPRSPIRAGADSGTRCRSRSGREGGGSGCGGHHFSGRRHRTPEGSDGGRREDEEGEALGRRGGHPLSRPWGALGARSDPPGLKLFMNLRPNTINNIINF